MLNISPGWIQRLFLPESKKNTWEENREEPAELTALAWIILSSLQAEPLLRVSSQAGGEGPRCCLHPNPGEGWDTMLLDTRLVVPSDTRMSLMRLTAAAAVGPAQIATFK